jgi:hypothetical protein
MNPATAYLVMARGTGRDNQTTAWSVRAIEKYTGMSRGKAKDALGVLKSANLVGVLRDSTKPKYVLLPAQQVPDLLNDPRGALSAGEQLVCIDVQNGKKVSKGQQSYAEKAVQKGWLIRLEDGQYAPAPQPEPEPEWIWLPNELVTGAANETPPVELVRQTQDAMTLRLLVDFYSAQNLREDGGISRRYTYRIFERRRVGSYAEFTVWGFCSPRLWVHWEGITLCHRRDRVSKQERDAGESEATDFFRRQEQLSDLGLVEWQPHLVESEDAQSEIIHPFGMQHSDRPEDRLGDAAYAAASAMLTDGQRQWSLDQGLWLAPVRRHMGRVQLVSIARLRYRPHTRMTAAWFADFNAKAEAFRRKRCSGALVEAGVSAG